MSLPYNVRPVTTRVTLLMLQLEAGAHPAAVAESLHAQAEKISALGPPVSPMETAFVDTLVADPDGGGLVDPAGERDTRG